MAVSDEELVERIKAGRPGAFAELVGRYQGKALAMAFQMNGGDRAEAEDLTQEAFLKVHRGLKGFKGRSSFHTWFHRIVYNTCLDFLRKRKRRERLLSLWPGGREAGPDLEEAKVSRDQDQSHDPLAALGSKEFGEQLRRSLARLPERQRLVFQMKVVQGLTIREIGEITGLAQGTVKSHLFRATRNLRKRLGEWAGA